MASPLTAFVSSPPPCRECGVETVIRQEYLLMGAVETLVWHCLRCHRFWNAIGATAPVRRAELAPACPRCSGHCSGLTLLTSMTRYYACARCSHRWREAVRGSSHSLESTAEPAEEIA
jgi:hypothetical protein